MHTRIACHPIIESSPWVHNYYCGVCKELIVQLETVAVALHPLACKEHLREAFLEHWEKSPGCKWLEVVGRGVEEECRLLGG